MKLLSAGLIFTDGKKFLLCHPTNSPFWDLPKGGVKPNEIPKQACIRETLEETDYDVSNKELIDLGLFKYTKRKKLHLFRLDTEELPPLSLYKCNMLVTLENGNKFMEMDKYVYVTLEESSTFVTPALYEVLKNVFENIQNKI